MKEHDHSKLRMRATPKKRLLGRNSDHLDNSSEEQTRRRHPHSETKRSYIKRLFIYKIYKNYKIRPGAALLHKLSYSYRDFRLCNKTLDETKQYTRRVFIGQGAMHIDWEHQQNKSDKGLREKTESNKKGHKREGTVLKDKHIQKNIPTLYNS